MECYELEDDVRKYFELREKQVREWRRENREGLFEKLLKIFRDSGVYT